MSTAFRSFRVSSAVEFTRGSPNSEKVIRVNSKLHAGLFSDGRNLPHKLDDVLTEPIKADVLVGVQLLHKAAAIVDRLSGRDPVNQIPFEFAPVDRLSLFVSAREIPHPSSNAE